MPSWWDYLLGGQQAPVFPQGQAPQTPLPMRPLASAPFFAQQQPSILGQRQREFGMETAPQNQSDPAGMTMYRITSGMAPGGMGYGAGQRLSSNVEDATSPMGALLQQAKGLFPGPVAGTEAASPLASQAGVGDVGPAYHREMLKNWNDEKASLMNQFQTYQGLSKGTDIDNSILDLLQKAIQRHDERMPAMPGLNMAPVPRGLMESPHYPPVAGLGIRG